jgi:tripartite ATP-independent transporter DctP family solute receptor
MSRKWFLILYFILAIFLVSCTKQNQKENELQGQNVVHFRYAENQPVDYPTTQAAYYFADQVRKKSNGRIEIEVFYDAKLGDEKSVIEQMRFGAIDFARVSLSPLAEFSKSLNVLQLPYLYRNAEHMWKVLDGNIGDEFLASVQSSGLVGLSWFDAGARSFYNSVRPIHTLEDMKGLRIRVQESQLMMDMITALGANPTAMAYGEVYSSLQTGVIDGAENNWPSYEATRHFEVAKYFLDDEHTRIPEMQIVSKAIWDNFSDEDQDIIKECALESAKVERQLWAEKVKASKAMVLNNGVIVTELSNEEKQKFQEATAPLSTQFATKYRPMIERIKATF